EDNGVGIKLAPDTRTTSIMKKVLNDLVNNKLLYKLFEQLHDKPINITKPVPLKTGTINFINQQLNQSQQEAATAVTENEQLTIIHGPPGTGKTTTLIEAIQQLIKSGEKVLVSAPSNTAVDDMSKGLIRKGVKL